MSDYNKQEPHTIQQMFDTIALDYDKTNQVMSFGLHRKWNRRLINEILRSSQKGPLIDLCAGTGEIAFGYLEATQRSRHVILLDFSPGMLKQAEQKANSLGIKETAATFLQADAQHIPLMDGSVGNATMAYGIRNVRDTKECLAEIFRVLAPGGVFAILELTQPTNRILNFGHQIYLKRCLPFIGRLFASDRGAYEYLSRSIGAFIPPEELEKAMRLVGFVRTERIPLTGGIATIIRGEKPL